MDSSAEPNNFSRQRSVTSVAAAAVPTLGRVEQRLGSDARRRPISPRLSGFCRLSLQLRASLTSVVMAITQPRNVRSFVSTDRQYSYWQLLCNELRSTFIYARGAVQQVVARAARVVRARARTTLHSASDKSDY